MSRAAIGTLVLALALAGETVPIQYDILPADAINRRLADFKDSNSAREQELHALFEEAGLHGRASDGAGREALARPEPDLRVSGKDGFPDHRRRSF